MKEKGPRVSAIFCSSARPQLFVFLGLGAPRAGRRAPCSGRPSPVVGRRPAGQIAACAGASEGGTSGARGRAGGAGRAEGARGRGRIIGRPSTGTPARATWRTRWGRVGRSAACMPCRTPFACGGGAATATPSPTTGGAGGSATAITTPKGACGATGQKPARAGGWSVRGGRACACDEKRAVAPRTIGGALAGGGASAAASPLAPTCRAPSFALGSGRASRRAMAGPGTPVDALTCFSDIGTCVTSVRASRCSA